jgi:hypothetical protein
MSVSRKGPEGTLRLHGVLDSLPGAVEVMPTPRQLEQARDDLTRRMKEEGRNASPAAVRAVYARGDGNDTPLGLPEALEHLVSWLNDRITSR